MFTLVAQAPQEPLFENLGNVEWFRDQIKSVMFLTRDTMLP